METRPRPGRPRAIEAAVNISITVPERLAEELTRLAAKRRLSRSALVRRILERAVRPR